VTYRLTQDRPWANWSIAPRAYSRLFKYTQ